MGEELPQEQKYATCSSGSAFHEDAVRILRTINQAEDDGMAGEWHAAVVDAPSLDDDDGGTTYIGGRLRA